MTTTGTQTLTNKTLTSPTITGAVMSSMASSVLTLGTAQNSTSGTFIDFTGIPSWARRIMVALNSVSTNGSSNLLIQIGSGSFTTSGYNSTASNAGAAANSTAGFLLTQNITAGTSQSGIATLVFVSGNLWVSSGTSVFSNASSSSLFGGASPALSGALDRVRITTVNGTDLFDAGTINVMWE